MSDAIDYARLTTPRGDGELLIEPPAQDWPARLARNRAMQARQSFTLAGHDLREVRAATRATILSSNERLGVIACGHQPAFVHPGVWAKHAAVRCLTDQLGLAGVDLVVDNDSAANADLIVPAVTGALVTTQRIPFSVGPAGSAYEGRPPVDRSRLQEIRNTIGPLQELLKECMLPLYLQGYDPFQHPGDFVDQHVAGRVCLDDALKTSLSELRVSRSFGGPFVADLLLNAAAFAAAYNDALRAYRQREHVRSPDRPLPDLHQNGERIESALWIYRPLERRRRLWVQPTGQTLHLFADSEPVAQLSPEDLSTKTDETLAALTPWVIRPRALTLTLWARLLVCDLFVHGIGGAKYDRITDEIFRTYYHCEAPAMACVTATLRLPLPRFPIEPDDLKAAERRARDLYYNPQRYVREAPSDLLNQREILIAESRQLRERKADRHERRRVYLALRDVQRGLLAAEPGLKEQFIRSTDQLRAQLHSNRVADSREFFYALQPRPRLEMLAERLRSACSV